MHETMVAQGLLSQISAEAKKQKGKPLSAKMSCGTFNAVNDEVLLFAFEAIAKGTVCEGMKLEIEHKSVEGKCKDCGEVFGFEICSPCCPNCQSREFDLLPDAPLMLDEIEFETE